MDAGSVAESAGLAFRVAPDGTATGICPDKPLSTESVRQRFEVSKRKLLTEWPCGRNASCACSTIQTTKFIPILRRGLAAGLLEPATLSLSLTGAALIGLGMFRRKKLSQK